MSALVRMFQPRFAEPVADGRKCQTIRKRPRRMPEPGDKISLRAWIGKPYRSKQRILRDAIVVRVEHIMIAHGSVWPEIWLNSRKLNAGATERFAQADGFQSPEEMAQWFSANHGLPFEGIVIYWTPAYHARQAPQYNARRWYNAWHRKLIASSPREDSYGKIHARFMQSLSRANKEVQP